MAAALQRATRLLHPLCLVLLLCLSLGVGVRGEFTHDRKRIGPLDVVRAEHACLEKFEVSESTIIRTEDSRMLGAQFLNESDVGNREDCLALCCATRFCNVAVFEEKQGSCFLFDCGKPGDLKCQFTEHSYYTSAVLRVNRHQLELGLWSEQSQHEAELANLSKGLGDTGETLPGMRTRNLHPTSPPQQPPPPPPPTPQRLITPTTTTSTSTTSTTTTTTTAKPTLPPRKCTRFQFECHSGECIAIYNACDGIPQCTDSSDEDPKLGCPAVSTEGASVSRRLEEGVDDSGLPQPGGAWDNSVPSREMNPAVYDSGRIFRNRPTILENYGGFQQSGGSSGSSGRGLEDGGAGYGGRGRVVPPYHEAKARPQWPGSPYNSVEGGMRGSGGSGGGGGGGGGGGADYMGSPEVRPPSFRYPDYGPAPRYPPPPRLPQQPPLQQQYLQPSPHQQSPQPQPQQQQQQLPQMNSNPVWMDRPSGYGAQTGQTDLHHQIQDLHTHHHPQLQPQRTPDFPQQRPNSPQDLNQMGGVKNTEMSMGGGGNVRAPPAGNSMPRGSVAPSPPPPSPVPPSTPPTAKEPRKNTTTTNTNSGGDSKTEGAASHTPIASVQDLVKAVAHVSRSRLEVNPEELQMGAKEQDAQASGAVLALAMGVCITALLVVLVGCRLRGVKRRLRRHRGPRSPYAHDADYLVNGMYL